MSDHEIGPIPIGPPGFSSAEEIERKQIEIEGRKAVEKKKREKRKKELFELLELDERYAKKEEGGGWWKKTLKLLAGIVVLFLGLLAALGKLEIEKWIEKLR